jgi:hypothetical protein
VARRIRLTLLEPVSSVSHHFSARIERNEIRASSPKRHSLSPQDATLNGGSLVFWPNLWWPPHLPNRQLKNSQKKLFISRTND